MEKIKNKSKLKQRQTPLWMWNEKDMPLRITVALGLILVLIKLVLASAQQVHLVPDEGGLDDMMMYNMGVSITKGEWLGEYSWMTLSKHSFFALWLAVVHTLGIPYLLAGQLLWASAAALAAWALWPVLKKRWLWLVLFGAMLFNPASVANPSGMGYVTRVYRDNIFPALCVMCVAGVLGYALRLRKPLRSMWGWAVLAGAGLAACWLTREDGWWMMAFLLPATLVVLVCICLPKGKVDKKAGRALALGVPFLVLAICLAGWSGMNYRYYGRFIISDFSSGEFADACGAMMRVDADVWDSKTSVPLDVRQKLYANVPEFAELEPYLESERFFEKYSNLQSGGFYWALRHAAAEAGHYDSPQKAQEYFAGLASEINALCDTGVLPSSSSARSSVTPPIKMQYVPAVLAEGVHGLWFSATFQQCEPYSLRSVAAPEKLQPMEDFLHQKSLTAVVENTADPYYSPLQKIFFAVLQGIRYIFAVALPLALLVGMAGQVVSAIQYFRTPKNKRPEQDTVLLWVVMLGILLAAVLRAMMIAFVTVASFNIGTYVMYLASVHPLLILYAFLGCLALVKKLAALGGKDKKENTICQNV